MIIVVNYKKTLAIAVAVLLTAFRTAELLRIRTLIVIRVVIVIKVVLTAALTAASALSSMLLSACDQPDLRGAGGGDVSPLEVEVEVTPSSIG